MLKSTLAIGAALLILGSVATAQKLAVARACVADVKALCEGVQPGEGRIRDCIKAHMSEVSESCKALMAKAAAVKACAPDVKQFCAETRPGRGRIVACMKAHVGEASDPCKDALSQAAAGKS